MNRDTISANRSSSAVVRDFLAVQHEKLVYPATTLEYISDPDPSEFQIQAKRFMLPISHTGILAHKGRKQAI